MTFKEALKKLNIEEYSERIINSNSHGELFHLYDYIVLAENLKEPKKFRNTFIINVKFAEENWDRPESIFQHVNKMVK